MRKKNRKNYRMYKCLQKKKKKALNPRHKRTYKNIGRLPAGSIIMDLC